MGNLEKKTNHNEAIYKKWLESKVTMGLKKHILVIFCHIIKKRELCFKMVHSAQVEIVFFFYFKCNSNRKKLINNILSYFPLFSYFYH